MEVPEKWGHRADALVAYLMAICALAVTIYGASIACQSCTVLPYLFLFLSMVSLWLGWIVHSLVMRENRGYFSPAAWHVAVATPLATLSLLSLLVRGPHLEMTFFSPMLSDRLIMHILLSLQWWLHQC